MMNNIAFIVDGFTELKIIQQICPGKPVKRTDLNGKNVTLPAIAKKIASIIRSLGNRHYPIVILIDKENREITYEEMAIQVLNLLKKEGVGNLDIRIGIPDRMIENWIIADWEKLFINSKKKPANTDCINGTTVLKKNLHSYDKTTDGVDFFISARQNMIYKNSPSFRYFIDQLKDLECNYLNFIE